MLLSFSVTNFKSFKEEQTIDLTASALQTSFSWLDNAVVPIGKDDEALRVKAIYGANASGKSNLIKALQVMLKLSIFSARQQGMLSVIDSFGFDEKLRSTPSSFEIAFVRKGHRYRYGFSADKYQFYEEWLYDETVRKAKIFTRKGQQVSVNKKYFDKPESVALLERGDNKIFRKDSSFLSALSLFSVGPAVKETVDFLSNIGIIGNSDDLEIEQLAYKMLADEAMRSKVKDLMAYADISFDHLFVMDKESLNAKEMPSDFLNAVRSTKGRFSLVATYGKQGEDHVTWLTEQGESQGTQKLLTLAPYVVRAIQQGRILVIDEFEAKLHTRLSREIVAMFNSANGNPNNAQFIFSTHDTNLLDHRLLRRDQIDFVDKGEDRASTIYSLSDVKGIRKEADFERDYLGGSYGAVPEVTEFNIATLED